MVERFSPWHYRSDETTYFDSVGNWVIGQVASVRNLQANVFMSQVDFGANAMPSIVRENGKVVAKYAYNSNGTVGQIKDGLDKPTTYTDWKRGIPQLVRYVDATTKSAVVDDYGQVAQTTDENGFTTSYRYDAMGRLSETIYPQNDSTPWNAETRRFEQVGSDEYGVGAGHWRQTVSTGNARAISYFDGLWRPVLTREFDAADPAGTLRAKRMSYYHDGKAQFESYPSSSENASIGTWFFFDAAGRPTSVSQDSEQGLLTTFTYYLPGLQTQVVNPRGAATLSGYQAFDQPKYDAPVWINHPEAAQTIIDRDVFGKPVRIYRGAQ